MVTRRRKNLQEEEGKIMQCACMTSPLYVKGLLTRTRQDYYYNSICNHWPSTLENQGKQKYLQDAWTSVFLQVHLNQGSLFQQASADHSGPASSTILTHLYFVHLSASAFQNKKDKFHWVFQGKKNFNAEIYLHKNWLSFPENVNKNCIKICS